MTANHPPGLQVRTDPAIPRANDIYNGMRLLYSTEFETAMLLQNRLARTVQVIGRCLAAAFAAFWLSVGAMLLVWGSDLSEEQQRTVDVVVIAAPTAAFLLWSVRRSRFGMASWQVLLSECAGAATVARQAVESEFRRCVPAGVEVRRPNSHGQRWMLRTRSGPTRSYLTVFPYGTGLSVGWTMLDEPNLWDVLATWLGSLFSGRGWFGREARSFEARALRDLLHQATTYAVATAAAASGREAQPVGRTWGDPPTAAVPAPPQVRFRDT